LIGSWTIDLDGKEFVSRTRVGSLGRASFSTFAMREREIGFGEFRDELTGIVAALTRPEFDDLTHFNLL
jgi:hypothetical protein